MLGRNVSADRFRGTIVHSDAIREYVDPDEQRLIQIVTPSEPVNLEEIWLP